MPTGSCCCGKVKYSYNTEPTLRALCHCTDCHKVSGSTYSTNYIVPDDDFKVLAGEPKIYEKAADSGNIVQSFFCGDCGSTMWREGPSFKGSKIIKVGTLDHAGALDEVQPTVELFTRSRANWVAKAPNTAEKEAM